MKNFLYKAVITVMCLCFALEGGAVEPVRNLDAKERPFEMFSTLAQLKAYREAHKGDFFNLTDEEYVKFDEEFFAENTLVMFLTQGTSGSVKCVVEDFRLEDNALCVLVKEMSPSMHTMDLRYNTLAVALPHEIARNISVVYLETYTVRV